MKHSPAAAFVSWLALAGPLGANDRCDIRPDGPGVLVLYPVDHAIPVPTRHRVDHVPWNFAPGPEASPGDAMESNAPLVIGIGDFIPGGPCDLLWEEEPEPASPDEHPSVRTAVTEGFTLVDASAFVGGALRPPRPWDVAGVHDLTGDRMADVLWWNPGTGRALLWVRTTTGWSEAPVNGQLPPAGDAEPPGPATAIVRFDPDAPPGIVWQPSTNSSHYRYLEASWNGQKLELHDAGIVEGLDPSGYTLVAVQDFDEDGKDDVLQQRIADKHLRICYMDGLSLRSCAPLVSRPTFHIEDYHYGWIVAGPR